MRWVLETRSSRRKTHTNPIATIVRRIVCHRECPIEANSDPPASSDIPTNRSLWNIGEATEARV